MVKLRVILHFALFGMVLARCLNAPPLSPLRIVRLLSHLHLSLLTGLPQENRLCFLLMS